MLLQCLFLSTGLSFTSLGTVPHCCSYLPMAVTFTAVCTGLFLFFFVFFLLLTLLMAGSPQVRDCPASRQAIDFYLGTY